MERISCENLVVKTRRFRDATQIHMRKVKIAALIKPSTVGWTVRGPNMMVAMDIPGVVKIRGEAIAAANRGMKSVTLFKKYLREIFDIQHSRINTPNIAARG
jgi:hypothetical protein